MKQIFSLIILIIFHTSAHSSVDWKLIENKKGLKLYSGPKSETGIYPFKAIFTVNHVLEHVVMVLADTSKKTEWVPRMSVSKTLEQKRPNDRTEYGEINMPWPLSNRDAIVGIKTTVNSEITHVSLKIASVQNENIINKRNIRAKVYNSFVEIDYRPKTNETYLEVESFVDPKGRIPKWVVNFFQKIEAKRMARQMRRQLDKNLYSLKELSKVREILFEISKMK
ncbi:MAG: hypothetical protein KC493_08765 [Bacteriovoracaceae bacterium]|nr:hypothetical protein [Bacteriovoracaceae bacterium]